VGRALPHLSALFCGVAAALAVGCGDRSHLVPSDDAQALKSSLAQVQQAVDAGDCSAASDAVQTTEREAGQLPGSVDRRLRARINQGVRQLKRRFAIDCANNQSEPTPTESTPTSSGTPPTTSTPPTTTTNTTTTPTTTTTTTTTTTEPPPSSGTPNGGVEGAPSP
jgi:hypothetical protein